MSYRLLYSNLKIENKNFKRHEKVKKVKKKMIVEYIMASFVCFYEQLLKR